MRVQATVCAFFLCAAALAQNNGVPGTDVFLYEIGPANYYGREGGAHPSGEISISIGHSFCNAGTVHVPWVGTAGSQMIDTYPKLAFLVARERDGRIVQISDRSFVKHSPFSVNFPRGACTPCQPGPSNHMRIGCSDTYGPLLNGSQVILGPPDEVDPWLGTFDSAGSYFDQGDPPVGGAAAFDNVKSLNSSMTAAFGALKNRVRIRESELVGGGVFHAQTHVVVNGEPASSRYNNTRRGEFAFAWNGSAWTITESGSQRQGSVLDAWTGASVASAGNGQDDGRFFVAVKVTGPTGGLWRYEYAVQNLDNSRGGATFRIPVNVSASVTNLGFHDIDRDPSNDWSFSRVGDEVTFGAGAGNALNWNTIYNFWFDCSDPPAANVTTIDLARPGPGAASIAVTSQAPHTPFPSSVTSLGNSNCGGAGLTLSLGKAPIIGATLDFVTSSIPAGSTLGVLMISFGQATPPLDLTPIGMTGCEYHGTGDSAPIAFATPLGTATQTSVTLQNHPALVGLTAVGQSFTFGASVQPLPVVGSNGLLLVLGRR